MLKHLTKFTIGTLSGVVAYYSLDKNKIGVVSASWTTGYTFSGERWDYNWDQRSPEVSEDPQKHSEKRKTLEPKACRHLILIRHGQYNIEGTTDKERYLTEQGRKQAIYTGERLKEFGLPYCQLIMSTMTRALETGGLIRNALPNVPVKMCPLLEEGAPVPPDPPLGHWKPSKQQFFQDGARIEAAFRKYFHRADVEQTEDSYEVIVCHANVIRYFVMRALQFPVEGWLRVTLNHASITWITIFPSGRVSLRCLGDVGFMPPEMISSNHFSGKAKAVQRGILM